VTTRAGGSIASRGRKAGSVRSVVREIDRELSRLHGLENAIGSERALLLAARAALTGDRNLRPSLRRRISGPEIAAHLQQHPGSSTEDLASALQATPASVSAHLHRDSHARYEYRDGGWHLRANATK
jgi:hypothetical protein